MATAFQDSPLAFQLDAFQIDQTVNLPTEILKLEVIAARIIVKNQPLIPLDDRYLVIGVKFDLALRRPIFVCEQVIFESEIVVNNAKVVLTDQGDHTTLREVDWLATPTYAWRTPPTSSGTAYDAIDVGGGWFVYIENDLVKWRDSGGFTTVLTWASFPPLSVDGSGELVVG